ncbi:MAG: DNA polymerase III subunit delta' [Chloroflexota bacterium]
MSVVASGWEQIVGHEWAVQLLSNAVNQDRVGHAYLITGPANIGRTTLARTFAQALNCTADLEDRPCGECRSCRLIAADRHPDIRVLEPETTDRGTRSIKIEQIRNLQQDLNLSAYEARYKVAILRDFETAVPSAANAFLKTLEEPPANVVLLLTATDADRLLPTIASRCHTINLRPVAPTLIEETLMTTHRVEDNKARLLAHVADGRIGWAITAAENNDLLTGRNDQLDLLDKALATSRVGRFALAETLAKKPDHLLATLRIWLSWWRDVTLLTCGRLEDEYVSNIDRQQDLYAYSQQWTTQQVLRGLNRTDRAIWQIEHNANTRLVLENMMLAYPLNK